MKQMTPLRAIRLHCLSCCGWTDGDRKPLKEVRRCRDPECYLYPFRQGKNPSKYKGNGDIQRKIKKSVLDAVLF